MPEENKKMTQDEKEYKKLSGDCCMDCRGNIRPLNEVCDYCDKKELLAADYYTKKERERIKKEMGSSAYCLKRCDCEKYNGLCKDCIVTFVLKTIEGESHEGEGK